MRFKKHILFAAAIIIILLINLIPSGVTPVNDRYFKDLEYLGMYNADKYIVGITDGIDNAPYNTNHILLKCFSVLGKDAFLTVPLSLMYCIILVFALRYLTKAVKDYSYLTVFIVLFVLVTKKYFSYLLTILPFGGIYTFFIAAMCMLIACRLKKSVGYGALFGTTVCAAAFAMYDNITAMCAVVLGILVIRLYTAGKSKGVKITSVICGIAVIALSVSFCSMYKGVSYTDIVNSGVKNGIVNYDSLATASSYKEIVGFYATHLSDAAKHIQILLNNAFYEADTMPFSLWHIIKVNLISTNIWMFTAILLAVFVFAIIQWKVNAEYRGVAEIVAGNIVICSLSLKMSGFFYGISELDINLLLFNLSFDVLICTIIVAGTYIINNRRKKLKEKFGVTQ